MTKTYRSTQGEPQKTLFVRTDETLYAAVINAASTANVSVNAFVNAAIKDYLSTPKDDPYRDVIEKLGGNT